MGTAAHRKVAITGASGGIGAETARGLVRMLPDLEHLYLLCRNTDKGERVAGPLRKGEEAGRSIDVTVLPLDLESMSSTLSCGDKLLSNLDNNSLDLLICNAGVMACPLGYTNDSGYEVELQFGVNHLSHALLTTTLLPALKKECGRVVFVSSSAVGIARNRKSAPTVSEKRKGTLAESRYERWAAYGDSKLAMSMYARALAKKESGSIESVSLHPGVVQTELQRHVVPEPLYKWSQQEGPMQSMIGGVTNLLGLKTPLQGAQLSLHLGSAESSTIKNGEMYVEKSKLCPGFLAPLLYKEDACSALYEDTQEFLEEFRSASLKSGGSKDSTSTTTVAS